MEDKLLEIINLILENKNISKIMSLDYSQDLRNDLGLDSFDLAELTVRIEDEFGVDVFENGLINKVGQITDQLK
jgi:acyl carrier protein